MTARDELVALYQREGYVDPPLVVQEAEATPGSELNRHLFVEFDDDQASLVGRLHRAHKLIQRYRVIDNRSPGETGPRDVRERVRLFSAVPLPDDPTRFQHRLTEDVMGDPIARALLLREAERAWKALRARFGHLQEFASMVRTDLDGEAA